MSGSMGGGRFGGSHLFDAFDADKDGSLTQAEVDKARKDQFDKFDANGNGKLDLKEYQALWLDAMRERMVDRFQGHDDDGNAQVTLTEFQKRFQSLIARLDENGDGKVTRQELRERFRGHGGAKER
ncbi:MAG: EF-hand domain-containing protein [Rhodospirillales bacterium]|nr:EF-hand domain-containing protein [Rhodospirillales bacterium]MDP6843180.1 EF-hand domain-containing protein [Rhodospirillales bacterium]